MHIQIVGESFHEKEIQKAIGRIKKLKDGESVVLPAFLKHEPKNKFDRNAIAVIVNGLTIGYVEKETAKIWAGNIPCDPRINARITKNPSDYNCKFRISVFQNY